MSLTKTVEFDCRKCRKTVEIEQPRTARLVQATCPDCSTEMQLHVGNPSAGNASNGQSPEAGTIPVNMGIPKVAQFQTRVTKEDAGKMAFGFLGAVLALMGIIVCAMLGIRPPKKS